MADRPISEALAQMAADGLSLSSLAQTVAAVRFAARRASQPDPIGRSCELVLRACRRSADPPRQVAAVDWATADAASAAAAARGDSIGLRDAAIVAVMSDAMLRVSEASALDVDDVIRADDGTGRIVVARSKNDQEGEGAALYLRASTVTRVDAWLAAAAHHDGPLFRPVTRGGRSQPSRLSPRSVRVVVAEAAASVGVNGASGHSLRIGAAQSLIRNGAQLPEAMLAGRWKSPTMPVRYARCELAGRGAVARLRPEAEPD